MLPRFCKLCFRTIDESFINLRRYSVEKTSITSEYFSDEEYYQNNEAETEYNHIDVQEPLEKPKKRLIIKCKRPQFNFYEDQVYPKFKPIPLASRAWQHRESRGDYFTIYPPENVLEDGIDTSSSFRDLQINETLLDNLEANNLIHPTSIQKLGIPKILNSQNVILTAETGCGKTFAFLVPLLQQIIKWKSMEQRGYNQPLGLILTPSLELAVQISKEARKLSKNLDIKIATLTGGQTQKYLRNPPIREVDLVIATIGVMNKLVSAKIYKLDQIKHVVLDEADTLLDVTFKEYLCRLLQKIPLGAVRNLNNQYPDSAQLTLNSATIPQNISDILYDIIDSSSLELVTTGSEHLVTVPQKFMRLTGPQKPMELLKLVKSTVKSKTPIIIFSNTTTACDYTSHFLNNFHINSIKLHKNMPLAIRRRKFNDFQNGLCNILTTTDAGARGLDTIQAKKVINFDFPLITSEYIHRCGRTGRIGSPKDCKVINFISRPMEIILTRKIEFATRKNKPIPIVDMIHADENQEGEFIQPDSSENELKNIEELLEIEKTRSQQDTLQSQKTRPQR